MLFRSGLTLFVIVNPLGAAVTAAYTVGMRLTMVPMVPGFGLGRASGALVGQNLGAGKPHRSEKCAWTVVRIYVWFMGAAALFYFLCAPTVVGVFNDSPDVVNEGVRFLRIVVWGYVFIAVGIVLAKSLQGAGDTVGPMVITGVSLFAVQLPLAWALSRWFGPVGVWVAIVVGAVTTSGLLALRFRMGHWKHKEV